MRSGFGLLLVCALLVFPSASASSRESEALSLPPPVFFQNEDPAPPGPLDPPFGTNVQVSESDTPGNQNEISMAVASDGRIHMGWNDARAPNPDYRCGYAYSTDGGATWSANQMFHITGWDASGDPVVVVGSNDVVYFVCMSFSRAGGGSRIGVYRSTDGGVSWSAPSIASDTTTGLNDKPWMHAAGSTLHLCYANFGAAPNQLRYTRSTDGGINWEPTRTIHTSGNGCEFASTPGNLYLGWSSGGNIYAFRSGDDGLTWGPGRIVGPSPFTQAPDQRAWSIPSFAADAVSGNAYAVWAADDGLGTWDVFLGRSTNAGASWTVSTVNDVTSGRQFMPWIDVAADGSLHVIWYDSRSGLIAVRYAMSTDGGLSWSASTRVTDVEWATAFFIGDYIAVDVDGNGNVHAGWCDRRTGENEAFHARTGPSPPKLSRIEVTPPEAWTDADTSVAFTATGYDQYDALFPLSPTWAATGGSIVLGTYTPQLTGDWTVWANQSGISGSAVVHVSPGALAAIVINPPNAMITADGTIRYAATGYDGKGNVRPIAPAWAVANSTIDSTGLFTPWRVGMWTVWANESGISGSTLVSVTPGALTAISVSPSDATVSADDSIQYSATGRDAKGNLRGVAPAWSVANGTIDGTGRFAPWRIGTWTVGASESGITGSALVTVTPGALVAIDVSPDGLTITADEAVQFTATGTDRRGNPVSFTPSWDATGGAVGAGGLYEAIQQGTWTVTANAGGVSGSAEVTVVPGELARIEVSPEDAVIRADATISYSARGYDADGNPVPIVPVWSATAGSIDAIGLYTPGLVGTYTIRAASGTVSGSTSVTVMAGPLARLEVLPASATITADDLLQLTATGYDVRGNRVAVAPSWDASCGSVDSAGLYAPGPARVCLVTATESGLSAVATLTVLPGRLARIEVTPPTAAITADDKLAFTASGFDGKENAVAIHPSWSAADGTVDGSGLFEPHHVGSWSVTATDGGVSGTGTVHVTPGALAGIDVVPPQASLTADETAQFAARGRDAKGNAIGLGTTDWSVADGLVVGGLFEPTHVGTWTVVASAGGFQGTAPVSVRPGRVSSVVLSPGEAHLASGGSIAFSATAYDAKGNAVPEASFSWRVEGGIGTVDDSGNFAAASGGSGRVVVTATDGLARASAAAVVRVDANFAIYVLLGIAALVVALGVFLVWAVRRRGREPPPPAA